MTTAIAEWALLFPDKDEMSVQIVTSNFNVNMDAFVVFNSHKWNSFGIRHFFIANEPHWRTVKGSFLFEL